MYLKQLEIEGFKSFGRRFTVEFHAGLNVLVGENGAGKTSRRTTTLQRLGFEIAYR